MLQRHNYFINFEKSFLMSLLSQQERAPDPSEVADQGPDSMARPFDRYLSLTGPKPAGSATSRRATFPSITAETEPPTTTPLTAPAEHTSQGGDQLDKKDEKQTTSEPKHEVLSRRATFPSTAKTESRITRPPTALPGVNTSQGDVQSDKKDEKQITSEPMHEILPRLYLGECVCPTLCQVSKEQADHDPTVWKQPRTPKSSAPRIYPLS